jgi:hypothetical protein
VLLGSDGSAAVSVLGRLNVKDSRMGDKRKISAELAAV